MFQIARLWKQLSHAIHTTKAVEELLDRFAIRPWESTDELVVSAWEALTRPENLNALTQWGSGDLNPQAREYTATAIQVCRSRSRADGEHHGAQNP